MPTENPTFKVELTQVDIANIIALMNPTGKAEAEAYVLLKIKLQQPFTAQGTGAPPKKTKAPPKNGK